MNQILKLWPAILGKQFTDSIIDLGNRQPIARTGIGFDASNNTVDTIRKSDIRWINALDPENRFIIDTLWNLIIEANRDHFGFDLNYLREVQYTTYQGQQGGKYDWHKDTFWINPTKNHRKLSLTIQLSDPGEYEGGEFEIDPEFGVLDQSVVKQRGTVLVFPSFLRHRVAPVTAGTRRSLVCWAEGPMFR